MTLINYLTRIHFANGVLEEALWSELDAANFKRPLILAEAEDLEGEIAERFLSGIPVGSKSAIFKDIPKIPTEISARMVSDIYQNDDHDILLAFGSSRAINLGKVARLEISFGGDLSRFSYAQGGSRRIKDNLPPMIATPGINGFAAAITAQAPLIVENGENVLVMCKKVSPPIAICDPSLTMSATPEQTASAGADAIAHCVEALLSHSYNPPAEGIARDGLTRAVKNLPKAISKNSPPDVRREIMAAGLNGALALQKGLGAAHAISNALDVVSAIPLDQGIVSRIVLPGVLKFNKDMSKDKSAVLNEVFKVRRGHEIEDELQSFFNGLPLPARLSELSLSHNDVKAAGNVAANDLSTDTNPRKINAEDYRSIMLDVL